MTYKVWEIKYSYLADTVDGEHPCSQSYRIIAKDEAEAISITDNLFSYCDENKELLADGKADVPGVSLSGLSKKIKERKTKIRFPNLTLDSDTKDFSLEAKISGDGKHLTYDVKKN